jgi:hypothetical protein
MATPITLTHRGSSINFNPEHIVFTSPNGGGGTNVMLTTRESIVVDEPFAQVDEQWRAALRGTRLTDSMLDAAQTVHLVQPPETPETPTPAVTPGSVETPVTQPSGRGKNQQPPETK